MNNITILLTSGTVGEIDGTTDINLGDTVTVYLSDENGIPIAATGTVEDILDVEDMYQEESYE